MKDFRMLGEVARRKGGFPHNYMGPHRPQQRDTHSGQHFLYSLIMTHQAVQDPRPHRETVMTLLVHLWVLCGNSPLNMLRCQPMPASFCWALVCPRLKALRPLGLWLRGWRQGCVLHAQAPQDQEWGPLHAQKSRSRKLRSAEAWLCSLIPVRCSPQGE